MLFERSFILKGYITTIGITISHPNSQVSRIFRLINVEILVIVIYVFLYNLDCTHKCEYGSLPKAHAKVLLFHEKAFANRTIRLSNRKNLHFL